MRSFVVFLMMGALDLGLGYLAFAARSPAGMVLSGVVFLLIWVAALVVWAKLAVVQRCLAEHHRCGVPED